MRNSGFEYIIDPDANCLFLKYLGAVTSESVIRQATTVIEDPLYKKNLNRISDFGGCQLDINTDGIREIALIAQKQREQRGEYREAMVVDSQLAHGLARIYDGFLQNTDREIQIFNSNDKHSIEEMAHWLSIPKECVFPNFMTSLQV